MRNHLWLIAIVLCVIFCSAAGADQILGWQNFSAFYNIYRPQTREEIYSSYRALVEKRDGISKLEARLIAQYEAVWRDLDHGYDIGKPKVVHETAEEWTVRFPSKFSINDRRRPPDMLAVINKANGKCRFADGDRAGDKVETDD